MAYFKGFCVLSLVFFKTIKVAHCAPFHRFFLSTPLYSLRVSVGPIKVQKVSSELLNESTCREVKPNPNSNSNPDLNPDTCGRADLVQS